MVERTREAFGGFDHDFGQLGQDQTIVVVDVAASSADVTVSFRVGDKPDLLNVTGPWLKGELRSESMIVEMLSIANDAVAEGRSSSAIDIVRELLERRAPSDKQLTPHTSILRPIIIPVRQNWGINVFLNEGAQPHPVDIWIRTLFTRDVG